MEATPTSTGLLPNGWEVRPFSEVCSYRIGRTPPRAVPRYWAEGRGFPWVSIADMVPFGEIGETAEAVSVAASEEVFRGRRARAGTLLMSFKLSIGRTSVLGIDAYHNEAIISIEPSEVVDRDFLRFYLPTINFARHQDRAVKGHTLNRGKIDRLPIVMPPLPEQRAIARILLRIQERCEVGARQVEAMKALKGATSAKLLREGLRGEQLKRTEIGEIPESWNLETLGRIATVRTTSLPFSAVSRLARPGPVRLMLIKVSDMNREGNEIGIHSATDVRSVDSDFAFTRAIPPLSIVFPKRGAAIRTNKKRTTTGYTLLDPNLIALVPGERLSSEYLAQWMQTFDLGSIAEPGAVPQLNKKDLEPVPVPVPHLDEQREISEVLNALDGQVGNARERLRGLQSLFAFTLRHLVAGQIRVPGDA